MKQSLNTSKVPNFKPLAIFSSCTARFVSHLVGNPKDRFCCDAAHYHLRLDAFFHLLKSIQMHYLSSTCSICQIHLIIHSLLVTTTIHLDVFTCSNQLLQQFGYGNRYMYRVLQRKFGLHTISTIFKIPFHDVR